MMALRRRPLMALSVVGLLGASVLGAAEILKIDWRASYSTRAVNQAVVNWPLYLAELEIRKFWRGLTDAGRIGLPQIRLFIPESSTNALMSQVPASTKLYQRGYLTQEDGSLDRVQIRYRGDNPTNWLFWKKSIRMKLRKKKLRDGMRVFNYGARPSLNRMDDYLVLSIADRLGVVAPRSRPVEIFINDVSRGIYVEAERYDESFLRNRNIMPVNKNTLRAKNAFTAMWMRKCLPEYVVG